MANPKLDSISLEPQPPQLTVRAARIADLPQLTELLICSFYQASGWTRLMYPALRLGIQEDLRQRLNGHKPYYACLSVVQSQGEAEGLTGSQAVLVGTVELSYRQPWPWQPMKPQFIYLSNLAVHPEARRQGVALSLLRTSEQIALQWGFPDLYLHVMEDNAQARKLYGKAGFRLLQTEESLISWVGLQPRRLLMHKPLS